MSLLTNLYKQVEKDAAAFEPEAKKIWEEGYAEAVKIAADIEADKLILEAFLEKISLFKTKK